MAGQSAQPFPDYRNLTVNAFCLLPRGDTDDALQPTLNAASARDVSAPKTAPTSAAPRDHRKDLDRGDRRPRCLHGGAQHPDRQRFAADIQGAIGAGIDDGGWISTSYLIAEIVVIPLSGWLAQVFSVAFIF